MKAAISIPTNTDGASMPILAKLMMYASAAGEPLTSTVEHFNAPEKVKTLIKAAVEAGSTGGWGSAITPEAQTAQAGFFESLRYSSVFFRLLQSGAMRRIPLRTRIVATTLGATAWVRGEGSARPLTKMEFAPSNGLDPREAVAMIVTSKELAMLASPAAQALLDRELRAAVAAVVDASFMSTVAAAQTATQASLGTTGEAIRADLRWMLSELEVDATSQLFFIVGTDVAKGATTATTSCGAWMFPEMGPSGGTMLKIPALVCDQIAADSLYLVDAAKIAAEADDLQLQQYRHASVQMDSAPDSPPTASTVLVNLWQSNLVGMLARTHFAAEVFGTDAVVELTSVSWGAFAPDSPT